MATAGEALPKDRGFVSRLAAHEIVGMIAAKEIGIEEVVRDVLRDVEAVDPLLNCFVALDPDHVLAQAARLQRLMASDASSLSSLGGLPIPVKDLIAAAHYPTTFGSKPFQGNRMDADAPAVKRVLSRQAILFGKTTTSEFGCKATGYSPLTGHTRNPWHLALTPGGSSSGSAAAVAAGLAPVALGTDGGGSVRIPAALTGIVGFKPTFGRAPVHPISATPTVGHVGVLARNVRDAALIVDAITGYDARDPYAVPLAPTAGLAACERALGRPRIAYSPTLGYARPDPGVLRMVGEATECLAALGCEITVVDSIFDDPADIWESEFYTDLAMKLSEQLVTGRHDMDGDVAAKLEHYAGRDLHSHRQLALKRYRLRDQVRTLFTTFDFLVTPTLPVVAFPVERVSPAGYQADDLVAWASYTYPFNLTGHPAISLPAGLSDGLPVGLQVVANLFEEEKLFTLAAAYEQARPWPLLVRP
jgi:aspartyl-tRNA(Asn)/glutamyl-tRNA(Gln) amidotransferase subunit A